MKCSDLQTNLPLYADGFLVEAESVAVKNHIEICPLCRQKCAEYRETHGALRQMQRPEISVALRNTLKQTVRTEIRVGKQSWLPVSSGIREWLQMRVMPYGVGVCASFLIGLTFLSMMFSGLFKAGEFSAATGRGETSIMLASNTNPFRDYDSAEISANDFARTRLGLGVESPSVNPQGALIALTKSLVRGGMKDDEVVVVADVFGNGLAQIEEVVEPSRNRRAVGELEKALESDAVYTPFVPSSLENRPEYVRVVLKFQSVNVSTGLNKTRHRL